MAIPLYRINTPEPGALIDGIIRATGSEVSTAQEPRITWQPLNTEAHAAFALIQRKPLMLHEVHAKLHGLRADQVTKPAK
jgi:hypothetical protein